jgi:hypothetical protein
LPTYQQIAPGTSRDLYRPSVPLYSAQNSTLPSRQSSLQPYVNPDIYGRTALRDLLGINECQTVKSGEGLLLPINFCSHSKGFSRNDEEEILQTPTGAKLFLSQGAKKSPDKLNQGLFFGANARILGRLIPICPQN